jgi:hypothetical protein
MKPFSLIKVAILPLLLLISFQSNAQRNCSSVEHTQTLLQDPDFASAYQERQQRFEVVHASAQNTVRAQCPNPAMIPMAVHFQGLGTGVDPTCLIALAQQQVQILNDDYAGTNADITDWTGGTSTNYPGINNGEACIGFALGTANHPFGFGLTEGEPAVTINQTGTSENLNAFSGYLNIYVKDIGGGILGYSPLGGSGTGDGVVIGLNYFSSGSGCGAVSPSYPFNEGRTLTHELGHYLNLDHIWGDGGCGIDDGVADTPVTDAPHYNCPSGTDASCGSPDLHMNYMDYVDDRCMYMFTEGQATRMESYVSSNLQNLVNNFDNVSGPTEPIVGCEVVNNVGGGTLGLVASGGDGASGYISGHNNYGDIAKAEYFSGLVGITELDGAEFNFGVATGTGNVEFVVWADNGGEPGAEIATQMIPYSTIAADIAADNNTMVDFGGIVNVSESFFIGFKLDAVAGNELAVNTNDEGATAASAWEQFSDGVWHAFNTEDSWNTDRSLAVYPNVCSDGVATDDIEGLSEMNVYPNPVSDVFYMDFESDKALALQIDIYDAVGRKVISGESVQVMGSTTHSIDATKLTAGTYFIRISNGVNLVTSKILKF